MPSPWQLSRRRLKTADVDSSLLGGGKKMFRNFLRCDSFDHYIMDGQTSHFETQNKNALFLRIFQDYIGFV